MKTFNSLHGMGVDKHLNQRTMIARGGGGGSSTSTTGLPEWAEPYAKEAVQTAVGQYKGGAFEHVEGLTPEQKESLSRSAELGQRGGVLDRAAQDAYTSAQAYRDAASGTGLFGADALSQQQAALTPAIEQATAALIGQQQGALSRGGQLGSARADALTAKTAGDVASNLAANELAQRRGYALQGAQGTIGSTGAIQQGFTAGAQQLGQVGSTIQAQQQAESDAAYQGTQRLFGLLGSPAVGSRTVNTGGGGK